MIVVRSKFFDVVQIPNRLIIYLDDGTVIYCTDRRINDFETFNTALLPYESAKMKGSNVNAVRY